MGATWATVDEIPLAQGKNRVPSRCRPERTSPIPSADIRLPLSLEECALLLCLLEQTSFDHPDHMRDAAMEIRALIGGLHGKLAAVTAAPEMEPAAEVRAVSSKFRLVSLPVAGPTVEAVPQSRTVPQS